MHLGQLCDSSIGDLPLLHQPPHGFLYGGFRTGLLSLQLKCYLVVLSKDVFPARPSQKYCSLLESVCLKNMAHYQSLAQTSLCPGMDTYLTWPL